MISAVGKYPTENSEHNISWTTVSDVFLGRHLVTSVVSLVFIKVLYSGCITWVPIIRKGCIQKTSPEYNISWTVPHVVIKL